MLVKNFFDCKDAIVPRPLVTKKFECSCRGCCMTKSVFSSLKVRLLVFILAIIIVSNLFLVGFLFVNSRSELIKSLSEQNTNFTYSTALQIHNINDREYKMLDSISKLPVIRDASVDLREKWEMINAISKEDSSYIGMAIYDSRGVGYTTTGKYQDLHTREYLSKALKGSCSILDPNWSPVNGKLSTFYAAPVYGNTGSQTGVVVAVIDSLALCQTVSDMILGKNSHPYVINIKTGKYVAHSDIEFLKQGKNLYENVPPELESVLDKIKAGKSGSEFCADKNTKKQYSVSYCPVGGYTDWTVICSAPADDFLDGLNRLLLLAAVIFCLFTVIAACLVSAFVLKSLKPLNELKSSIKTIASGHGDLTKRISISSNDEIGEVVEGFNEFIEKLHGIVSDVKDSKGRLVSLESGLSSSTQSANSSISNIVSNIDKVNEEISKQSDCVETASNSMNEIAENISRLNSLVHEQAKGTENASAAVEEMTGNIHSVNNSVEKMAQKFETLLADAQKGSSMQYNVSEKITHIAGQSASLQDANAVIASIAEQTNLLAMNAAIEAAHAGEAGKGFSVVADEIRKLSETSSSQSHSISEQLNGIQSSIQDVVSASDESTKSFVSVVDEINAANQLMQEIKNAMLEQQEGSSQINSSLAVMRDSSNAFKTEYEKMNERNKSVLGDVARLREATSVMNSRVSEMEQDICSVSDTGKSLLEISSDMSGSIKNIGTRIDEFKV